ncbi:2-phosphosulfolactate phosphatase [Candidatus Protochlamydia naegleriophila]|uniref:Probable 2-phosphosulfolactate phosphatase n=1 Tax=Candidatus Protochlamydia naegleriophila TaxID=389348 RepID=A0A0U5JD40_9BACT|nr:2-phosphosulfolactate phosphatase [Candidatus Protochlamydia naegleriophila]CUI16730.1 2-phosphosulfolactate phosphatase [Candidatus Protochlamydia naegleriophila]
MKCQIYRRSECHQAKGLCIIIDVLRAFTTAAFAFAAGAKEIIFVSTQEEAFQKYENDPTLMLMGETFGRPISGFHFGNSPAEFEDLSLKGHRLVQRTSAGTQGVVGCRHAEHLLVASFVVADATLEQIKQLSPSHVSFIVTGMEDGDEDLALADYLIARLQGQEVSSSSFLERVKGSPEGKAFADPALPGFAARDLELAIQIDRFPFAMEVIEIDGNLIGRPVYMS